MKKSDNSRNDPSRSLFVGDLSVRCNKQILFEMFSCFGEVTEVDINQGTPADFKPYTGFGFVTFATLEQATNAKNALHGKENFGRKLRIGWHGKQHYKHVNHNAELSVELFFSFRSSKVQNLVCEQSIRDLVTRFTECPIADVAFKTYIINTTTPLCFGSGFLHLPVTHEGVAAARILSAKLHNVTLQDVCYDFKIAHSLTEVFAVRPELSREPTSEEQAVLTSGRSSNLGTALSYATLEEMQHLIEPQNLQWDGSDDRCSSGSGKSSGSESATSSEGYSLYSVQQQQQQHRHSPVSDTTWQQPFQQQQHHQSPQLVGWLPQTTELYAYTSPPPAQPYYYQEPHIQQQQHQQQQQTEQLYAQQVQQLAARHQQEREAVQRAYEQHQRLLNGQQLMQRNLCPSQWQTDQEVAWRVATQSPHQAAGFVVGTSSPPLSVQYLPPPEYAPRPSGNLPSSHQLRHFQQPPAPRMDNFRVPEQLQWPASPVQQQQQHQQQVFAHHQGPNQTAYHQGPNQTAYHQGPNQTNSSHCAGGGGGQSTRGGHHSDGIGIAQISPHVSSSSGAVKGNKDSRASRKGLFNNMRYNPKDQPGMDAVL